MQKTNGNTTKKPTNTNQKQQRMMYGKTFEDFIVGLDAIRALHPAINSFFSQEPEPVDIDSATRAVTRWAAELTPLLLAKENIHRMFNISSNSCFVKTESKIGFGWVAKFEVIDGRAHVIKTEFIIHLYSQDSTPDRDYLINNGWKQIGIGVNAKVL